MRRWKKITIGVFTVFGLSFFALVIHHYQLRFALEKYIAERKAAGEPMDLEQVLPRPVPAEKNAVPFIIGLITNKEKRDLFTTNPPQAMQVIAPGRAMTCWMQSNVIGYETPYSWEILGRNLVEAQAKLQPLQNLSNHPNLDFHLNYQQRPDSWLPHSAPLRSLVTLLKASALSNLRQRMTSRACADVHVMLALIKGQTDEPMIYSQYLRINNAQTALTVTWEILKSADISEDELALLQCDWDSLEFVRPVKRAYLMERVLIINSSEKDRENPEEIWQSVSYGKEIERSFFKNVWRAFWTYSDEKNALQIYGVLIEAAYQAETNNCYKSVKIFTTTNLQHFGNEKPLGQFDGFRIDMFGWNTRRMASENAIDAFGLLRRGLMAETFRNMVVTAIALKRYELKKDHLPVTLAELIPDYLKSVPTDWMDGQPLRYRQSRDRTFQLYSVGENGNDDDGNPSRINNRNDPNYYWLDYDVLDWVWPQPATPEEAEKFRAKQVRKLTARGKKR